MFQTWIRHFGLNALAFVVLFIAPFSAAAFDVRATFRRIDREQHSVTVVANGNEHTARVSEQVEVIGADGKEIPERLAAKIIAEGASAQLTVESINGRPTIVRIDFSPNPKRSAPDRNGGDNRRVASGGRTTTGLKPICDMTADDRYQGEDGGLYGNGRNVPTDAHQAAAKMAVERIRPLDAEGRPSPDGKIALISISMSNATQEFSTFKRIADVDEQKSSLVEVVDCAQGGKAMAEWAAAPSDEDAESDDSDPRRQNPWRETDRRLARARISPQQVQVAWVKIANKGPRGGLSEHGKKLENDTTRVLQIARRRFPNLQIVYLSSRIYAGYAENELNPEPYAYESGFVARWLIQKQQGGDATLQFDAAKGEVQAPLLLWGPYLWADGTAGRKTDSLVWTRDDLAGDGTHPTRSGCDKVAQLLLDHFHRDPYAKPWYVRAR